MAELPELTILTKQMNESLTDRTIKLVEVLQAKCLNVPVDAFVQSVTGMRIERVTRQGKWIFIYLAKDKLVLLNLGMGADLLYYSPDAKLPIKYQLRMALDDGSGFTCRFWWFGHIRFLTMIELPAHKETAKLGPSPMEITAEEFLSIAARYPKKNVKSLILDQDKLSGIGNAYAHDILWKAKLHPGRVKLFVSGPQN